LSNKDQVRSHAGAWEQESVMKSLTATLPIGFKT